MVSESDQLLFLTNIQRILNEGVFTSTYKFALLHAMADICVERGNDSGESLPVPLSEIAEKFVDYYWRQSRPYLGSENGSGDGILRQNTGKTPVIIKLLCEMNRKQYTLPKSKSERRLLREVERTVRKMPLVFLQNIGNTRLEFLYDGNDVTDRIILKPGVMSCFRKFYPLITDLIRGAWVRYIRRNNPDLLGVANDLDEFLFGSERAPLGNVVPILEEIQKGDCFYCKRPIKSSPHVDHFIPWTRYPLDLGHNFVLAHNSCNLAKSDMLAAEVHLENWARRNQESVTMLESGFGDQGIPFDLASSNRIAIWAYGQAHRASALTWLKGKEYRSISDRWRRVIFQ